MTQRDDTVARWMFTEVWGVPPEVGGNLSDEENLDYGKALLIAANGDGRITDAERAWVLGYLETGGHSTAVLEELRSYDGGDKPEDLFTRGVQQIAQRVCICDAVRACGADGDLSQDELNGVHRMAERLGVPKEVVDEFVEIYHEEQRLKTRRVELAFPNGFAPPG